MTEDLADQINKAAQMIELFVQSDTAPIGSLERLILKLANENRRTHNEKIK